MSRGKAKAKISPLTKPCRILSSEKIEKGGRKAVDNTHVLTAGNVKHWGSTRETKQSATRQRAHRKRLRILNRNLWRPKQNRQQTMTYRRNGPTRQAEKPATPYITGQEKEITHPGRLSYPANFQTETARNKKNKSGLPYGKPLYCRVGAEGFEPPTLCL